jgi:hypothetical protein
MIELDDRIKDELERLVPLPEAAEPSWEDALRRAQRRPERARRRLTARRLGALAFAALFLGAVAASPVGGAVAGGIGDFSEWLRGEPGEPATEAEQRAFESENARSWAAFPDGPKLRRLVTVRSAGARFDLLGFRTGGSLCLRLSVAGIDGGPATGCAPIGELRSAREPALVVVTDYTFGRQSGVEPNEEGFVPAQASATFGIVADGVEAVDLLSTHGRHRSVIRHNAFVSIVAEPPLGLRTKKAFATMSDGRRFAVATAEAPFGNQMPVAKSGVAPGPTEVERRTEGGTVGWLLRREERGQSLEETSSGFRLPPELWEVKFVRVVRPDPDSFMRLGLALVTRGPALRGLPRDRATLHICSFLIGRGAGGGCSPLGLMFSRGPFTVGTTVEHGGNQYAVLSGIATDEVERMELFLATGERVAVPLEDNGYIVEVSRSKYPLRLVAYDADDQVIGIEHMSHDPLADPGPRPVRGKQRTVKRVVGENGTEGVLRVGPSTDGGRCWRVAFTGGAGGGGCPPKTTDIPPLAAVGVQNAGGDSFLTGTVGDKIASVRLRLASGRNITVEPVEDFVLYAVPAGDRVESAIGFNARGDEVARRRFSAR